jgi:hypothetical protein
VISDFQTVRANGLKSTSVAGLTFGLRRAEMNFDQVVVTKVYLEDLSDQQASLSRSRLLGSWKSPVRARPISAG